MFIEAFRLIFLVVNLTQTISNRIRSKYLNSYLFEILFKIIYIWLTMLKEIYQNAEQNKLMLDHGHHGSTVFWL